MGDKLCVWLSYSATLITRPATSEEECEKLCREEAEIDCNYYMFSSAKSQCSLTAEPDPTILELKKLDETDEKKSAESWVTQLQARVTALEQKEIDAMSLQRTVVEMKAEIENLKSDRTQINRLIRTNKEQADQNIAAVEDKVDMVQGDVKRMEETLLSIGDMQKTFGNKLRLMKEELKSTGLTVALISQTTKDQRSNIREIEASITDLRTSVTDLKKSVTDLQVRFAGLSTDVMEKVANVDAMVGPELNDLKYSQTTLAQALGLLTKKIMTISPRIPELQKRISAKEGRFTGVEMQMQSLGRQISFLSDRLSFSEGQLKRIVDPASRMNVVRRQNMMHLQSQVDTLVIAQTRLQNDLLAEVSDRTRIYKELSDLKLDRKSILDQMVNQDEQVRDLKKTVKILIADEPRSKLVSNILSRQLAILRSLKRMQDNQDNHQSSFVKYKAHVEIILHDVMKQIERRRATDQALTGMQTKLFVAYHSLKSLVESDNTRIVVQSLIDNHNHAVQRINSMRILQDYMSEALLQNKLVLQSVKNGVLSQHQQSQRDVMEIANVRRRVIDLYSTVATYKMREELGEPTAAERLAKVDAKQNEIIETISHYRMDIEKTQSEINAQRKMQLQQTWKSMAMLQQIQALRRSIKDLTMRQNSHSTMLEDLRHLITEQIEKQASLIFTKTSNRALINEVHNVVAEELEKQSLLNARKNKELASLADINRGIRILRLHVPEGSTYPVLSDIQNAVAEQLENEAIRNKNKRLTKIADINRGFRVLRQQQIESDAHDDMIDDIHTSVTSQLMQQPRINALKNRQLKEVAELNRKISLLRQQQKENLHDEMLHQISHLKEQQLRLDALKTPQTVSLNDAADLNYRVRALEQQHRGPYILRDPHKELLENIHRAYLQQHSVINELKNQHLNTVADLYNKINKLKEREKENQMLDKINNVVMERLEQQSSSKANKKNKNVKYIADLSKSIRQIKQQQMEQRERNVQMENTHDVLNQQLIEQSRLNDLKNEQLKNVAELYTKLKFIREQKRENEQLRQEMKLIQDVLDYMQNQNKKKKTKKKESQNDQKKDSQNDKTKVPQNDLHK